MSRRTRSERAVRRAAAGATLLEMSVALLILSVTIVAMARLILAQSRMLDSLDAWCGKSPTLYAAPPQGPFEAECGVAASLVDEAPGAPVPPPAVTIVNDVEILSLTRVLLPPTAAATVKVTPR